MESAQAKKKRPNHFCCVPQCTQYSAPGISFHHFPRDAKLKKEWETKLRMGKPSSVFMLVCSKYFLPTDFFPTSDSRKKLLPKSCPSQNLPQRRYDRPLRERKTREPTMSWEGVPGSSMDNSIPILDNVEEMPEPGNPIKHFKSPAAIQVNLADYRQERTNTNEDCHSVADILCEYVQNDKCTQVNLQPEEGTPVNQDGECVPNISLTERLQTNEKVFTFTGIHSVELLNVLVI